MDRTTILNFVESINKHDLEAMGNLMTDEHVFIDSHNNGTSGKEKMKESWKTYFDWFPDYTIELSDIIEGQTSTSVFGFANGTYKNLHHGEISNHYHLPAAWKVIVENDKIKLWQVFCDTKIPFDIMQKNQVV